MILLNAIILSVSLTFFIIFTASIALFITEEIVREDISLLFTVVKEIWFQLFLKIFCISFLIFSIFNYFL